MSIVLNKDIRASQELVASFNQLAEETFEINFSGWEAYGYWSEAYTPYTLVENNEVVANASVTKMTFTVDKKAYSALQIGTVMTRKSHRHQGLSKQLITEILEDYKGLVDIIFLFANESVLEFYPRFGFTRVKEAVYVLDTSLLVPHATCWEQVNFKEYQQDIEKKLANRHVAENLLNSPNSQNLELFYYSTAFSELIYYDKQSDVYVIYEIEGETLHLFDVLSTRDADLMKILESFPLKGVKEIVLHFPVDTNKYPAIKVEYEFNDEDALFILGDTLEVESLKIPLLNHA